MKATAWAGCSWGTALPIGALFGTTPGGPLGLLAFLLIMFVPQFETMFAEFGASLPIPTILVLELARSVRGAWFLWLPAVGAGLTLNTLLMVAIARFRGWLPCVVLGFAESALLVCLPVLALASLYLPIFSMAQMIE